MITVYGRVHSYCVVLSRVVTTDTDIDTGTLCHLLTELLLHVISLVFTTNL
jgi:hypothetical protein